MSFTFYFFFQTGERGRERIRKRYRSPSQALIYPLNRSSSHGGEESLTTETHKPAAKTLCTQIRKGTFNGKSCSKTLLARVYRKGNPKDQLKLYAIIDDQSNKSLVSPGFFQHFSDVDGYAAYTLSSCMGRIDTCGEQPALWLNHLMEVAHLISPHWSSVTKYLCVYHKNFSWDYTS